MTEAGPIIAHNCGYGMGWSKFQSMLDEIYDVRIGAAFAMQVVETYRATAPAIPAFWKRLEAAFRRAVATKAARVAVQPGLACGTLTQGGLLFAYIELPSGRRLYYAEPEVVGDDIKYWGRNIYAGGRWDRVGTWGGKLTENVVQAAARDVMAEAMLRLDRAGAKLLLTVHDEIIAEDDGVMDIDTFRALMVECPAWAPGLPVDVETFKTVRYRK